MNRRGHVARMFERQWLRALALIRFLVGARLVARLCQCFHRGEWWGISAWTWFWIAVEKSDMRRIYGTV